MKSATPHSAFLVAVALASSAFSQVVEVEGTGWLASTAAPGGSGGTLSTNSVVPASGSSLLNTLSGSAGAASNAYYTAVPTAYNSATFGGDLWIGFTGGRTTGASASANFKLSQGTDLDSGMVLRVGSINGSDTWDVSGGPQSGSGDPAASALSMTTGDRLSFVLIHIDYTANGTDAASVWIFDSKNDAPTEAGGLGAAVYTLTGDFAFDRLGLYAAANSTFAFDTIRLADSYQTAVPEPSTCAALLGAGVLGVAALRRRRLGRR